MADRYTSKEKPFILFFTRGITPTPNDRAVADMILAQFPAMKSVAYRNVQMIDSDHPIEPNDGVAGAIPPQYRDSKIYQAVEPVETKSAPIQQPQPKAKPAPKPPGNSGRAHERATPEMWKTQ